MTDPKPPASPPAVWWSPEYQRFYALPGTPPLVEEVETRFMPSDIQPMMPNTGQAPTCGCGFGNPAVACVEELHETAQSGYQRGYRHALDTVQGRESRPVYPQVWCDDSSGPNGIGGTCVLGPGHLHRDGLGGEWPVEPAADTVQAPTADLELRGDNQ